MGLGALAAVIALSLNVDLSTPPIDGMILDGSAAEASLTKAQVEPITVQLDGVPRDARVLLDGVPVDGLPIRMPRDEALHDIEVTIAGMQPWRIKHRATDNGSYRVVITVLQAPNRNTAQPAQGTPAPSRRADRPARRAPAGSRTRSPAGMMDSLFRNPGF
jgi:hypothetical protein